ncbi:MAG: hypothetical protein QM617_04675 [Comamonas sp.]
MSFLGIQLGIGSVDVAYLTRIRRPFWVRVFFGHRRLYEEARTGQKVLLTREEENELVLRQRAESARLFAGVPR